MRYYLAIAAVVGCTPPSTQVCVGATCTPPTADTAPPPTLVEEPRRPGVDTGGVDAAILSATQRVSYMYVAYETTHEATLRVGSWSTQVEGSGEVRAPIAYTDLCVLEQDIIVTLEVDDDEVDRVWVDTEASVQRPGGWRWWTDGDGSVTVECDTPLTTVRSMFTGSTEIVWDAADTPQWQRVLWELNPSGGAWTMQADRITGRHEDLDHLIAEPTAPLAVALVRWVEP